MLATFIDVEEPVLNVYAEHFETVPEVGAVIDFGLPEQNSMRGAFTVLSHESMLLHPSQNGLGSVRVNVIRKERLA